MRRDIRVKAFIGNSEEIEDVCLFLHNEMGIKSADLAWTSYVNNEVIKVNTCDYADAVMLGSVYIAEKGYRRITIVSLANQRLNQVEDTANYAKYKMHIKGSIKEDQAE